MGYNYYNRRTYFREDEKRFSENCEFLNVVTIPEGWNVVPDSVWCYVKPPHPYDEIPVQGWKIHISAIPSNAYEIFKIASEILFNNKIYFKVLSTKRGLYTSLSKNASRGASGKFMTIYPKNVDIFKYIINELYSNLKKFEGPYILSDKRYKDCKVLYYRYGGFSSVYRLEPSGEKTPCLISPNGDLIPDIRTPYFNPPEWAEDPFPDDDLEDDDEEIILNNRYKVIEPIRHSNMGGLYIAEDIKTSKTVLIKEARPYTFFIDEFTHSFHILMREYEILKFLYNKGVKNIPRVLDIFDEWEHKFMVLEFIEGETIDDIASRWNPLMSINNSYDTFENVFCDVFSSLANILQEIHKHGISHGDISINNILIKTNDSKIENVNVVDFEGASIHNKELAQKFEKVKYPLHMGMHTPGFIKNESNIVRSFEDDLYGLGVMMIHSLIGAIFLLKYVNPDYYKVVYKLSKVLGFPVEIAKLIDDLLNNKASYSDIKDVLNKAKGKFKDSLGKRDILSRSRATEILQHFRDFVNNITFTDDSIPYPVSGFARNTNVLSMGFGVLGIVRVLNKVYGNIDKKVYDWIEKMVRRITPEDYPPGLMSGLAGISWALWDLGFYDLSIDTLKKANSHSILFNDPGLFYGCAGVGYSNLLMFIRTRDTYFLDQAVRIGEYLYNNVSKSEEGFFWTEEIGYGNGQSGIALFLLYLSMLSNDDKFTNVGIKAIKFDLNYEVEPIGFPPSKNINIYTPYLEFGSAGVGKVINRYIKALGDTFDGYDNFKDRLDKITSYMIVPWVTSFTYFFGASGMAEFFMDIEHPYSGGILSIINDVLFQTEYGLAAPSENHAKINLGFGDGLSGIIAVFYRYVTNDSLSEDIWNYIVSYIEKKKR